MDDRLFGPGLGLQPGLQQVRLAEGHSFLPQPQAHPASALVYDGRFHQKSLLMEKGSRYRLPSAVFQASWPST